MQNADRKTAGLNGQQNAAPPENILSQLIAYRSEWAVVICFSLFVSLLMLTGPIYMLQIYDRVIASGSMPTLIALTVLMVFLYITLGIIDWVRSGILSALASRFEDKLADDAMIVSHASKLADSGRAADKPLRDLRTLRKFVSGSIMTAILDAPFALLYFVVLFIIHWAYGALAIFGAVIMLILALINQRVSHARALEAEKLEQISQLQVREFTENAEIVEALGMHPDLMARWRVNYDQSDNAMVRSGHFLEGFSASTKAFRMLLQSAVLGLGGYLFILGVSTPGAMIAASIITGRAIAPLTQIVSQWRSIMLTFEAWTSLNTHMAKAQTQSERTTLPAIQGHLAVENVSAGPPGAQKPVLAGLNFAIVPGDVLGIIGQSASGKSTLARLIVGTWPAQVGTIRIDGAEMSTLSRQQLGPQIGYLPQRVDLFSGTVRDNIARFDAAVTDEDVITAAQQAGCHDMILHLPDGYDTAIGANGAYLSAGQRQRLGLARALLRSPALIVLDEPNSNLDAVGEDALQLAIAGLKARGATTLIIAHRPTAIAHCNKLMMLENGRMRAFGPREEVLSQVIAKQAPIPTQPASVQKEKEA